MLRKNKIHLLISSILILLPILAGLLMWDMLPNRMASHFNASGAIDGWSGKATVVFGLPTSLLLIHWLCVFITSRDPKNKEQSSKVFRVVLWLIPMISIIINGAIYSYALHKELSYDLAVRAVLAIMLLLLGNYMPKCRQNHTIGIRVVWTLRNEENWNKTHRFAGRLWVISGILVLATMLIPLESITIFSFILVICIGFLPMLYSYVYYRKQLKEGTIAKESIKATPFEKKSSVVALVAGICILCLAVLFLCTGGYEVQYYENYFTIDATYWDNATINYADIDNIEYREWDNPGKRTFGFGSFHLLMGEFLNDEFGAYTRYSYTACDSCIVLSVGEETLVMNGENVEATKAIYDTLTNQIAQ